MDFDGCACSGKSLGRLLQPAVMGVLAGQPLHGYLILQRLASLAMFKDDAPDATGLYRLLKCMEEHGYVVSAWDLADSGPAKRRYSLTRAGRKCLRQWTDTLDDYVVAVTDLLDAIRKAPRRKRARQPRCCRGACHA